MRRVVANRRKKDLPLVLNKVVGLDENAALSADNPPVAIVERNDSTYSSNKGTNRPLENGWAIVGNGSVSITVTGLLATDTVEYPHGGDSVTLATDTINIPLDNEVIAFNIIRGGSLWASFNLESRSQNYLLDNSGFDRHGLIVNYYAGLWIESNEYSALDEVGYTLSDGVAYYLNDNATGLIEANIYIPKLQGSANKCVAYLANGERADLQYIDRAPSRGEFKESNAWAYSVGSHFSIVGLLTTDTVEAYTGSAIPTIPVNGQLHIATGEIAYGVIIKRSGVEIGFYPFSEYANNPANFTAFNASTVTVNKLPDATLINGSTANRGLQDVFHYSQLGIGLASETGGFYEPFDNTESIRLYGTFNISDLTGGNVIIANGTTYYRVFIDSQGDVVLGLSTDTNIDVSINNDINIDVTLSYVNSSSFSITGLINGVPYTNTSVPCGSTTTYPENAAGILYLGNRKFNGDFALGFKGDLNVNVTYQSVDIIFTPFDPYQIPILADLSGFPKTPISEILQDGNSFLDTGTKLQATATPRVSQAEKIIRKWTDANGDYITLSHADFTGAEAGDQDFNDISETGMVKNMRKHHQALTGRQLLTEKVITKN